jgi:AbiU2
VTEAPKWVAFPAPVRHTFEDVWQAVALLHSTWKLYLDLFDTRETIQVLNATAPAAFQNIEVCVRTHMVMAFGRLIDPATQGKNENLSLERLAQVLKPHADLATSVRWEQQVTEIQSHCAPIGKWRDKRYAHTDRKTTLEYHANPLPGVSKADIDKALELLRNLLNDIQGHFANSETPFEHPLLNGTGADLLHFLRVALDHLRVAIGLNQQK